MFSLECYILLAIPLVVDSDASSDCRFPDGVAIEGSGIAQVLECGGEILVLTAIRVTAHIATKLMGKVGDAVERGLG